MRKYIFTGKSGADPFHQCREAATEFQEQLNQKGFATVEIDNGLATKYHIAKAGENHIKLAISRSGSDVGEFGSKRGTYFVLNYTAEPPYIALEPQSYPSSSKLEDIFDRVMESSKYTTELVGEAIRR